MYFLFVSILNSFSLIHQKKKIFNKTTCREIEVKLGPNRGPFHPSLSLSLSLSLSHSSPNPTSKSTTQGPSSLFSLSLVTFTFLHHLPVKLKESPLLPLFPKATKYLFFTYSHMYSHPLPLPLELHPNSPK